MEGLGDGLREGTTRNLPGGRGDLDAGDGERQLRFLARLAPVELRVYDQQAAVVGGYGRRIGEGGVRESWPISGWITLFLPVLVAVERRVIQPVQLEV